MIYIDASRYSNTEKRTGVENYSYFLLNEITKQAAENITLITPKKIDLPARQLVIPFPRLWTQLRLSWEVFKNKKINNLFVPSHVMPVIHPKNTTITIHDVAFKRYPKSYGLMSRWYLDWGAKFAVKHAQNIIVPSQVTKQDLIQFYNCPPKKIHVIPLGIRPRHIEPTQKRDKYFLYIGRIETKKNTDTLIKGFEEFAAQGRGFKLILAGSLGRGGKKILASIPKKLKNNIVIKGYVTNKERDELMRKAAAVILPSRFEGFGLPLLEAMQFHTPIIASEIPSSREVADGAALFFKTEDATDLAQKMQDVLRPETKQKLIKKQADILPKYSWEKAAKATLNLLKN